ncbi:MAG: LPS export ABC transporter periplasmic protein LptC [bacterium JZ-2024 1]
MNRSTAVFIAVAGLLAGTAAVPQFRVQGSRVTLYDGKGNPVFRTHFASVQHLENVIRFGSPKGELFTEGGPIRIVASEGTYQSDSQMLTFYGAVEGTQEDLGLRFSAESISFSLDTREATSDRPISIRYGPFSVFGKGFSVHLGTRRLTVRGEVKGAFAEAD